MSTRRKFNFALSVLTHSAALLEDALADPDYQADMTARLGGPFITAFTARIAAVNDGSAAQSSQTGDLSQFTEGQRDAFREMERLASAARRTARLAFPGQETVLGAEFQVGSGGSKAIGACIARATFTHAACVKYAAELQAKGWITADTTALGNAINTLGPLAADQDEAGDDRLDITNQKNIDANLLYADCLAVQNAARLQYPANLDPDGNEINATARARFLLNEFPPATNPRRRKRNSHPHRRFPEALHPCESRHGSGRRECFEILIRNRQIILDSIF